MLRWLAVLVIALMVFEAAQPWLHRIGLGRLPGDLRFRLLGRQWHVPIGSAVLLSVIGWVVGRLLA